MCAYLSRIEKTDARRKKGYNIFVISSIQVPAVRALFPKTTFVSVIGTALLAALAVYMLVWAIYHLSQLGDDGINPITGQQWKPTTFDLVLGYACFSLLAIGFILFA